MSSNPGRTSIPVDEFGNALSRSTHRLRTYRTIPGYGQSAAKIPFAPVDQSDFAGHYFTDDFHPSASNAAVLDAAFRAAEEAYGEHGGGTSASWPGLPAVAWSQPVGIPGNATIDDTRCVESRLGDEREGDRPFAIPRGFPHTREIGAFSALTSRRVYAQTPPPVVASPMAFRPDGSPPLVPHRAANVARTSADEGLAESSDWAGASEHDERVKISTRIFILSGIDPGSGAVEGPSPDEPIPLPPAPTLSVNTPAPAVSVPHLPVGLDDEALDSTDAGDKIGLQGEVPPAQAARRSPTPTLVGNLPSSVLTSAAKFVGDRAEPHPVPAERKMRSRLLIFGLTTVLTIVAGTAMIGLERSRIPWLRDQASRFGFDLPRKTSRGLNVAHSSKPAPAPATAPAIPSEEGGGLQGHVEAHPNPPSAQASISSSRPPDRPEPTVLEPSPIVTAPPPAGFEAVKAAREMNPTEVAAPGVSVPSLIGAHPPAPHSNQESTGNSLNIASQPPSRPAVVQSRHHSALALRSPQVTLRHSVIDASARPFRSQTGRLDAMSGQAEALLATGNILEARAVFKRVAAAGDPRGARGVARTYDGNTIARSIGNAGIADREKSILWYKIANSLEGRRVREPPTTTVLPEDLR